MCTRCISAAHSYCDWLVQCYGFLLCTSCYCFKAFVKIDLRENNNRFLSIRNNNHNINKRTHRCQKFPDRVSGHEWTHKRKSWKSWETNMFAPEKNWPQEGKESGTQPQGYFTSTSINANTSSATYEGESYVVGQQVLIPACNIPTTVADGQYVTRLEVWEWAGMNLHVRRPDSRFARIYICVKVRVKVRVRAGIENHKRFIRTWKGSFYVTTRHLGDENIYVTW